MRTIIKDPNVMEFRVGPVPGAISSTARAEWLFYSKCNVPSRSTTLKSISIYFEYSDGTAGVNTYTLHCARRLWGRSPKFANICTRISIHFARTPRCACICVNTWGSVPNAEVRSVRYKSSPQLCHRRFVSWGLSSERLGWEFRIGS